MMSLFLVILSAVTLISFRRIIDSLIKDDCRKRELLISVIIATLHSVVMSLVSLLIIFKNMYYVEYPALVFSAGYFICDSLSTLLYLKMNRNNMISLIHHVVGLSMITSRLMYPEGMPVWIGVYLSLTEITMPTLNLQWFIETYCDKKKCATVYRNLFRFNLLLYAFIRIGICDYAFIVSVYHGYVLSIINYFPLVFFNSLWFYQLIEKYRGVEQEMF